MIVIAPSILDKAILFCCGGIGAFLYSFPVFLSCRKADCSWTCYLVLIYSIFTGAIFGLFLTPFIGHKWSWTIDPVPYPLSIGVGLLANPLLPKIIEKGTAIFNSIGLGGNKP